jgi:hypothetical protein
MSHSYTPPTQAHLLLLLLCVALHSADKATEQRA